MINPRTSPIPFPALDIERTRLNVNLRFLGRELQARGVARYLIDGRAEAPAVEARLGAHRELLFDVDSAPQSYAGVRAAADKWVTKQLLVRAGIAVPRGRSF
jgi:hypothetical protein